MAVHCDYIVGVALHEHLLACVRILPDEDAACRVVYLVVFEDEIWIVEGTEGKGSVEFKERVRGKHSNHPV